MIKFRYVYSNEKEIKTFIYTIEEIENDTRPDWDYLSSQEGYKPKDFKLISRDRFTGLKDKNGECIFENDVIKGTKENEYQGTNQVFFGNYGDMQPFSYLGCYEGNLFEIISNTHIEELRINRCLVEQKH